MEGYKLTISSSHSGEDYPELDAMLAAWASVIAHRAGCIAKGSQRGLRPSGFELQRNWRRWAMSDRSFPLGAIPIGRGGRDQRLGKPPAVKFGRPDSPVAIGYFAMCVLMRQGDGRNWGCPRDIQALLCWLEAVPRYTGTITTLGNWSPFQEGKHLNGEQIERVGVRLATWKHRASLRLAGSPVNVRVRRQMAAETQRAYR